MATMRILQRGRMDPNIYLSIIRVLPGFSLTSDCDKGPPLRASTETCGLHNDAIVSYGKAIDPKAQATGHRKSRARCWAR